MRKNRKRIQKKRMKNYKGNRRKKFSLKEKNKVK